MAAKEQPAARDQTAARTATDQAAREQAAREQAVTLGDFAGVIFLVPLDGREVGRAGLRIHRIHFFLGGVVYEDDRIAAHSVHGEIGHAQRSLAGNGRIEGIAARLQNLAGRIRRLRLHGRHRSVASANDGTHRLDGIAFVLGERQ